MHNNAINFMTNKSIFLNKSVLREKETMKERGRNNKIATSTLPNVVPRFHKTLLLNDLILSLLTVIISSSPLGIFIVYFNITTASVLSQVMKI